ncbi:protein phosphatase 2C domain-containing protein [candidate division KSB1 bacterium]|nr:protein phosphatase 2C domain-containing protein [candidate division KSB1 bacterium]
MKLVIAAATDVGTVREANEDFFYYSKPSQLIVVCDGMGGHQSGAVASRIAGKTLRDVFFHADFAELARLGEDLIDQLPPLALRLVTGARLANRRLLLMAQRDAALRGMGTTLVALALGENNGCVVHAGDSRLYQLRHKKLTQITEDHSLVNQLLQDRDIRADQVKHFRKKNVLTRALGTHPTIKVDVQWFPVQASDVFLLCTDGFHNALDHDKIEAGLNRREADLQKMVDGLTQAAKTANGSDNITVAIASVEKVAAPADKKDKETVKTTAAEESEKVLHFEDKFIKEKYLLAKSGSRRGAKSKRHWWSLFSVLGVLMLSALVYGMINRTWPFEAEKQKPGDAVLIASSGVAPSAGLVQSTTPPPAITAPPIGGYLVFMHVSSSSQLDSLRQFSGVRVLDQFNPSTASQSKSRNLSRPILPGNYSLVIVDSLQSIVYRRDDLHMRAVPAVVTDTTRRAAATANLGAPATPSNEPPAVAPQISSRAINDTTRNPAKDTLQLRENFNQ